MCLLDTLIQVYWYKYHVVKSIRSLIIGVVTVDGLESLRLLSLELRNIDEGHLVHVHVQTSDFAQKSSEGLLNVVSLQEILKVSTRSTSSSAFVELQES